MSDQPNLNLEIAMEVAFPQDLLEQIAKKFGAEKARECAMSTSVGGIGPLLKDRVFGQAELGWNIIGVSLLYDRVWVQSWHEWGQLNLQKREVMSVLKNLLIRSGLDFEMPGLDGKPLAVEVWEWNYGKGKVYFLSSPPITDVVYPGPKDAPHDITNPHQWSHEFRLKQGWLLGRGALTFAKKINQRPNVVTLSETPTIFGHAKIVKDDLQTDPFFSETKFVFNDHTPLEYAHPIWDQGTIDLARLDPAITTASPGWNSQKKTLDVTSLLVGACDGVFGVAKKHGEVMRAMPSLKLFASKIQYITNGVRKEDWQSPDFSGWEKLTAEQLLETKHKLKKQLLDWAWRRCRLWPKWADDSLSKKIVVLTRRITPYKRLDILLELLEGGESRQKFLDLNLIIFIGGRIHQQDNHAQDIVYDLLDLVEKDPKLQERVIFLDNFNIWEAPLLFHGADATIMMADDTREASATGFMKGQMNGAAIIATPDGAVPEFVHFEDQAEGKKNGFIVPYVKGEPTSRGLLEAFEQFSRALDNPAEHAALIRAALAVTPEVDVARTSAQMKDFYEKILCPNA